MFVTVIVLTVDMWLVNRCTLCISMQLNNVPNVVAGESTSQPLQSDNFYSQSQNFGLKYDIAP